jgi:uncharacterized tellurite resistance protein B-like protein|tara:strand:+ start:1257 stop:1625 length:369 start_codon:yes stop_codon:yes gene_type:complete
MGIFSDLFKESDKWNDYEISALYQCLMGMAAVDGKIDKEETDEIINILSALPGAQNKEDIWWNTLLTSADAKEVADSVKVLKEMHSKKKKHVLYGLAKIAMADGEASPIELKILNGIQQVLK